MGESSASLGVKLPCLCWEGALLVRHLGVAQGTGLLDIRERFGDVLAWAAQGVGVGGSPSLEVFQNHRDVMWSVGTVGWGWT